MAIWSQLLADARFFAEIRRPRRQCSVAAAIVSAAASKGWWLLATHRVSYECTRRRAIRNPVWWILRIAEAIGRYSSVVLSRSESMGDCQIDGPVFFSDKGYLILGAKEIGAGTFFHDTVTVGMTVANARQERPTIGKRVWIGSNCVIAGDIHIGDDATIMPGSYVTRSVPRRSVAAGNPARIVGLDYDNSALRNSLRVPSVFRDGQMLD